MNLLIDVACLDNFVRKFLVSSFVNKLRWQWQINDLLLLLVWDSMASLTLLVVVACANIVLLKLIAPLNLNNLIVMLLLWLVVVMVLGNNCSY